MPWSYSALSAWELCPRKYFHESIAKTYKQKPNEAADYGTTVHKAFELRLKNGKPLPLDLRHHEPVMKKLEDANGEGMTEQKVAINQNFQGTGFFDSDVWMRAIVDYTKLSGGNMIVLDYKTGKMQDGFEQVKLQAAAMFCILPEAESAKVGYYWTKEKKLTLDTLTRKDLPELWNSVLPRVNRMQEAVVKEEFPARQNFLCKRHCPVKTCPFNGG